MKNTELPKNPKEGEIYRHKSDSTYYYRWNGFAWETISYITSLISIKNEIPAGKNDGENSIFSLSVAPSENSEKIFLNGLLQKNGLDYIIDNDKIIFNEIPMENSTIICFYDALIS